MPISLEAFFLSMRWPLARSASLLSSDDCLVSQLFSVLQQAGEPLESYDA